MECGFNLDARGQFPRALLSCSTNYKPKIGQECPTAWIRRLATLAGSAMRSIKQRGKAGVEIISLSFEVPPPDGWMRARKIFVHTRDSRGTVHNMYRVMPSNLPSGNGTEGAVVCTDLGRQLRPQFYFLWVSLMASLCISLNYQDPQSVRLGIAFSYQGKLFFC